MNTYPLWVYQLVWSVQKYEDSHNSEHMCLNDTFKRVPAMVRYAAEVIHDVKDDTEIEDDK